MFQSNNVHMSERSHVRKNTIFIDHKSIVICIDADSTIA